MSRRRFSTLAFAVAAAGVLFVGGSNSARADLRLTLTAGMTTQQFFAVGNNLLQSTTIDGYTVVLNTVSTNFPGDPSGGTLSTTVNFSTAASGTINDLTILAEVVTAANSGAGLATFTVPAGGSGYNVFGQAGATPGNATAGAIDFTATVNGTNFSATNINIPNKEEGNVSGSLPPGSGYTMTQTVVIKGVNNGAQSVTVNASQRVLAAPAPGALVLLGSAVPFLGLLRRRMLKTGMPAEQAA